jgi:RNA polymerase sigma factor (TIGR02999 family)
VEKASAAQITDLLGRWHAGDAAAEAALLPMVYQQLRAIARRQLARGGGDGLAPTELVHEAYLRLNANTPEPASRAHFFAIAARAMRQVLIEHERQRRASKRDGGLQISLSALEAAPQSLDLLALDQALHALEALDARMGRIIELRVFAGLDLEDIALALDISRATVFRDFRAARAWLYQALQLAPT